MQSLRNVDPFNANIAKGSTVNDKFVGAEPILVRVEDLIVVCQSFHQVISIQESDLSGFTEPFVTHHSEV